MARVCVRPKQCVFRHNRTQPQVVGVALITVAVTAAATRGTLRARVCGTRRALHTHRPAVR
eukprot:17860-Eustigmatos_ZCMA.PRE.1